jgi:membrane-bound metal-dependent hydrolase YbcI (DUF457 family)
MWPPGHLAAGYLLATGWHRWRAAGFARGRTLQLCLLASLLPDIVDKTLAWGLGVLPGGRTLTHSLLCIVPLCALVLVVARHAGRVDLGAALSLGLLSHPLLDALPALWEPDTSARHLLWPVLPVETVERSPPTEATVQELLVSRLATPWLLVELAVVAVAVGLWYRARPASLRWQ